METNGNVSANNEAVISMPTTEQKAKIAQCLACSMEIKGAIFYHQPDCGHIRVYKIVNCKHVFECQCYNYQLDELIQTLAGHVAENA